MYPSARPKKYVINALSAVSSAVLLSIVHAYPRFWFVSLFALVPFLWRLCYLTRRGSIALGIMLATSFALITGITELSINPTIFIFRLISLNAAFIMFGYGVNRIRKSYGFDPLAIALIWFPIEYVLISFANLGGVFSISQPGSKTVVGFYSLFGLVLGSLAVVLVNTLILLFLRYARGRLCPTRDFIRKKPDGYYPRPGYIIIKNFRDFFLGPRAPPRDYSFKYFNS
jgi:hypothetical protein